MHFTYSKPEGDSLRQGDILVRTDSLDRILHQIHPHYEKQDYTHFIVLTQSCDLSLRESACETRYISVAAVRPLDVVLRREIEKFQRSNIAKCCGVACVDDKRHMQNFLKKLFNNNIAEYFYLESEASVGLQENSCAFLRLSVPIKSELHYDSCVSARILSLKEAFRAKLGWLVGNLYSRVGTEDWTPHNATSDFFDEKIEIELDAICKWLDRNTFKFVTSQIKQDFGSNPDIYIDDSRVQDYIDKYKAPNKKEQLVKRALQVLTDLQIFADEKIDNKKVYNALFNDSEISRLAK